jgi:hypothetical protein
MATTAHLTVVAPDNEKFTVPIGAKQIAQAQSLLTSLRSGDGSNYNWPAPKPFRAGKGRFAYPACPSGPVMGTQ